MVVPWMENDNIHRYVESQRRKGKLAGEDFATAVVSWKCSQGHIFPIQIEAWL